MSQAKFNVGDKITLTYRPAEPQVPYYQHGTVTKVLGFNSLTNDFNYAVEVKDAYRQRWFLSTGESLMSLDVRQYV